MKKTVRLLFIALLFGNVSILKAQCYGTVNFDQAASANGTTSFDISTTYCSELILISYDGLGGPGTGPVTVDGNSATLINTASSGGAAETYAYIAPAAGVHTILCTETGYTTSGTTAYDINFAADFYATGTSNPLTIASLTSAETSITCNNGGPISDNINTTAPNSMIYSNVLYDDGESSSDAISWTGATFLNDTHIGDGIEGSDAYTSAAAAGAYTITAMNSFANNTSSCGGLNMVLVAIPPPLCSVSTLVVTTAEATPSCGSSNGSISLTVGGGTAPYTYTWGSGISTTDSATGLSAGTYTVTVNDGACPPEDTTLIIILATDGPQITANVTANEKCNGNCNGSATVAVTGGLVPYTYNWMPAGGATATATGLCAGTYTITVTDNSGCFNAAPVTITQPALLTATTMATNALCNGGTGNITVTAAGGVSPYNYLWTPSGQNGMTAAGLSAGQYTVTVTDSSGCTVTAPGTITQPNILTDTITGPQTLCSNGTGILVANAGGGTSPYIYSWSTGGVSSTISITITSTQTYAVGITDVNGCTSSANFTVTLAEPPTISVRASETSICEGTSTVLQATATNASGSFTWQPGSITGPSISVSPAVTTTYTVSVTGICGTATGTITIIVSYPPVTAFSADVTNGCPPLCTQFRDMSTSGSGNIVLWEWSFGNGDVSNLENPIYCYQKSGNYTVDLLTVTDSGCSSTLHTISYIDVYSLPVAAFTASPQPTTLLQSTIQFTDESTDAYGIVGWEWTFGDGADSSSVLENPLHTYMDTGTYCASLVVVNQHGCVDSTTSCITIDPIYSCYIPDAFSPNGDGLNDIFEPKGNDIKSFEMYIYDRWEGQIFHSNDINVGWNGEVNGSGAVCQEDTYYYLINVKDNKNKLHSYTGIVCLLK